ncbi:MAG: hypothetical protein ACYTF7_10875 [Planctomycetota bacterium]|jgi:hypothetical protein
MASGSGQPDGLSSWLDAGWLFLAAGIGVLVATVLIPAGDDLARAHLQRDRALALEERSRERLRLHSDYLDALARGDETVMMSLVQQQLNAVPEGMSVVYLDDQDVEGSFEASVVRSLEPPPTELAELALPQTRLRRLTTDNSTRVWLILGGGVCVLLGLLPPSRVR